MKDNNDTNSNLIIATILQRNVKSSENLNNTIINKEDFS